jgi:hypothetical protein
MLVVAAAQENAVFFGKSREFAAKRPKGPWDGAFG